MSVGKHDIQVSKDKWVEDSTTMTSVITSIDLRSTLPLFGSECGSINFQGMKLMSAARVGTDYKRKLDEFFGQ